MDRFKHNGAPLDPSLPSALSTRQKQALPVKNSVPSFRAFRAQTPPIAVTSPVRRKPLPPNASPLLTKAPSAAAQAAVNKTDYEDSPIGPTLRHPPTGLDRALWASQPWPSSPPLVVRDLDRYAAELTADSVYFALLRSTKQSSSLGTLTAKPP